MAFSANSPGRAGGVIDDLKMKLYGDGPGELMIEDVMAYCGLDEQEMASALPDDMQANPTIDDPEWASEWDNIDQAQVPASEPPTRQDNASMALKALTEKANRRAEMSGVFQRRVASQNRAGG